MAEGISSQKWIDSHKERINNIKGNFVLTSEPHGWHPIKGKFLSMNFHSIEHYINFLEQNMDVETKMNSSMKEGSNFTGSNSLEQTIKILKGTHSDSSSNNLYSNVVNKLRLKGVSGSYLITNYSFDTNEGEVDIQRVIQGEAKCYMKPNKKFSETFYDIVINIAILSSSSNIVFEKNIVNIIYSIYKAEVEDNLKIRVILVAESTLCSQTYKNRFSVSLIAKNYNEQIDLKKLLAIFHKSNFRRGMFRIRELLFNQDQRSGYGCSCNDEEIISMNTNREFTPEIIRDVYMKQLEFGKQYMENTDGL